MVSNKIARSPELVMFRTTNEGFWMSIKDIQRRDYLKEITQVLC